MKRRFLSGLLISAVFLFGCPNLEATVLTFDMNGATPASIPDNNATGIARTFTVTGIPANATINSVAINLNINHTWVGDLRATLTSPDSETHTLFYDIGDTNTPTGTGDSSNLAGNYLMSDAGATTLWTAAEGGASTFNIPSGTYRTTSLNINTATSMTMTFGYPELPLSEILTGGKEEKFLSDRAPEATNGTWTLTISDNATGDIGTINAGTTVNVDFSPPTAANAFVEGRLVTTDGRGVMNSTVLITNTSTNEIFQTRSSSFGFFRFNSLPTGTIYVIQVISKRYQFPARVLQLDDNVTDLIIQADGQ